MKYRHFKAWFSAVVIGTASLVGCGDDGQTASTGTTGAGTSSATGTGGAGGEGTSTSTGTGGEGGAQASKGAPGSALVSGGHVISSPKYRMVFTVGQSSPVQKKISSPSYSLRGGLIGVTEGAK